MERQITIEPTIPLDPGENVIEVVAYNARNLLSSPIARITVASDTAIGQTKGNLHAIILGINDYGNSDLRSLRNAVPDATAFADVLRASSSELYDDVYITMLLDHVATSDGLESAFREVGKRMHVRDTFIFFAAAHGKVVKGRFHLITSNTRRAALDLDMGHEKLQTLIVNNIRARRGLILLDTCESGALVTGAMSAANSESALGRLNEATGRPVLTATAANQVALEGYQGPISAQRHGIFTYALLDALINGDTNRNGHIELSELTAHVQKTAPQLSRMFGKSPPALEKSRAAKIFADAPIISRYTNFRQKPKVGSRGEDFSIFKRVPALPTPTVAR